jgi:hypothetical protein
VCGCQPEGRISERERGQANKRGMVVLIKESTLLLQQLFGIYGNAVECLNLFFTFQMRSLTLSSSKTRDRQRMLLENAKITQVTIKLAAAAAEWSCLAVFTK